MKSVIQIFRNTQFGEIRTMINEQGDPIFCLPDLCNALGLTNPSSVKNRLDDGDVQLVDLHALNFTEGAGNATANFVNESGFYDVLLQSSSPKVKPFRKWVTSEVLPAIRKHGGYLTAQKLEEALLNPDTLIQLATNLKEERQKRELAEAEKELMKSVADELHRRNEDMKPKALFADAVATSNRSVLVSELAKVIKQNGFEIGQNRLFAWMRENGYLCSKGEYYNQPTQKAMQLGLFEIKKQTIGKPDGTVLVTCTTKVTGKGQIYFIDKFLHKKETA